MCSLFKRDQGRREKGVVGVGVREIKGAESMKHGLIKEKGKSYISRNEGILFRVKQRKVN